jgi:hypothetical protein
LTESSLWAAHKLLAALTYGAGFISKVDKWSPRQRIMLARGKENGLREKLDIDMVAGPSEVLVIADGTATRYTSPLTCSVRRSMTSWQARCWSRISGELCGEDQR